MTKIVEHPDQLYFNERGFHLGQNRKLVSGKSWRVTIVGDIPAQFGMDGVTANELRALFAGAVTVSGTVINSVRSFEVEIGDQPAPLPDVGERR